MGGGRGDKKSWLEGGYARTFLVKIRGEQNKNIVTREPITEQSRQEEGGCRQYEYRWKKKTNKRLSSNKCFRPVCLPRSNFKAKQVGKIANVPSSNSTPNERSIVPKFQPVFVAWASSIFEEHNSLRTGLKKIPNFSYQVPGTCGSKLRANHTEPHIHHMSQVLVLGVQGWFFTQLTALKMTAPNNYITSSNSSIISSSSNIHHCKIISNLSIIIIRGMEALNQRILMFQIPRYNSLCLSHFVVT